MATTSVHGHIVEYEENAEEGIHYLIYSLNGEEAKVFFDQALSHGSALFEDSMDRKYKLTHKGGINYELVRQS